MEQEARQASIIESSKSIDMGICYGLSFLWNAESPILSQRPNKWGIVARWRTKKQGGSPWISFGYVLPNAIFHFQPQNWLFSNSPAFKLSIGGGTNKIWPMLSKLQSFLKQIRVCRKTGRSTRVIARGFAQCETRGRSPLLLHVLFTMAIYFLVTTISCR